VEEKDAMRASVLCQVQNEKEADVLDLDSLDDVAVDRLYQGTMRTIAKDSRR